MTFEVTESAQFSDTEQAIATLQSFRARGIRISMDDYGTGQSALNYLKLLPLSELKIDRMFVAQAHVDRGDAMLVRPTVQLAHQLGLRVVAEGIEEAKSLAMVHSLALDAIMRKAILLDVRWQPMIWRRLRPALRRTLLRRPCFPCRKRPDTFAPKPFMGGARSGGRDDTPDCGTFSGGGCGRLRNHQYPSEQRHADDLRCNRRAVLCRPGRLAETGGAILKGSGARTLRWGPPRSAWTMDYRQDRVNVRYDDAMMIEAITCG